MFKKLFTNLASNQVEDAEPKAELKGKTTNEIIEEIHETFFSEVDRLLSEAKISKSVETDKEDLIKKSERLRNLGFYNTKEVSEAIKEKERLYLIQSENEEKKSLVEAINYFSQKYPQYKFITEKSVKKICAKYNLIYGSVDKYIGEVPEENLRHIENFKIQEMDECFEKSHSFGGFGGFQGSKKIVSFKEYQEYTTPLYLPEIYTDVRGNDIYFNHMRRQQLDSMQERVRFSKLPLEIAAPVKDFDTNGMELKDFRLSKIEIPDPVVLKPVFYKGEKHFLIVTAWGKEASDELVVNQINN